MKAYIGDSVYAEWDGYQLTLTTENGYPDDPLNRIVLEPEIWSSLVTWFDRMKSDTANARIETAVSRANGGSFQ